MQDHANTERNNGTIVMLNGEDINVIMTIFYAFLR